MVRAVARIFVTRAIEGDAVERLRAAGHEVAVHPGDLPPTRAELLAGAAGAEGLLSMLTERIDDEVLDAAPDLRAIANYAVGCDNIDLAAVAARGIPVGVTPDVLTDATADLTMALLLAAARHLPAAAQSVRDGAWKTFEPRGWLGLELRGARIAIVGPGRIGRAIAERAQAFGMEVELRRPRRRPARRARARRRRLRARPADAGDAAPDRRRRAACDEARPRSSSTPHADRSSTRPR